ncbi:ester cyclase [Actinoplanes subglobosus]|uniref:Ester cyclase n=1 Tax=Actinoplanes subglobosus TaxID=1547892 RepID=A0ABV8J5E8_9ACTN
MLDRRSLMRGGAGVAFGAIALATVAAGEDPALAGTRLQELMGDPAQTGEELPWPSGLTRQEHRHLKTFDELDFVVYSGQQWDRLHESHAENIRVHYADGRFTDGIDQHIADLKGQFVWAPDTRISKHPIRIAKGTLTAVTGVVAGTFSQPMPDGQGGTIAPTGRRFAVNMVTVGIWNRRGVMSEEFLFMDSGTFTRQIGLG